MSDGTVCKCGTPLPETCGFHPGGEECMCIGTLCDACLAEAFIHAGVRREYAIRQVSLDTGKTIIHSPTENEAIVQVWRERKMDRQDIVWREVGAWQDDDQRRVG